MPDYIRLHAVAHCTTVKVSSVSVLFITSTISVTFKRKKKSTIMRKRENKNRWISLTLESHLSFRNINLFIIFFFQKQHYFVLLPLGSFFVPVYIPSLLLPLCCSLHASLMPSVCTRCRQTHTCPLMLPLSTLLKSGM